MKNKLVLLAITALFILSSFLSNINCSAAVMPTYSELLTSTLSSPSNSKLIGVEAAKTDTELTLGDMLTYAIQDEYLAKTKYSIVVEKFREQRPFINIISAEVTHINYLTPLFTKYNIVLPADTSKEYIEEPSTIKESLEAGVQGEIENIAMYERFLKQDIPSDIKTVFTTLKNASQNHLNAFQRALTFY